MGACQSSSAVVDTKREHFKANPTRAKADDPTNSTTPTSSEHPEGNDLQAQVVAGTTTPKMLSRASSAIGLDSMIESRREVGDLVTNVVRLEPALGQPIEAVYEGVHDGPILGKGIMGIVRKITHRVTRLKYAVKCLDLTQLATPNQLQQLRNEVFIMCQLDHPNIVRLEEVYESEAEIYLVMELCFGGDLFDRLDAQVIKRYTEGDCAMIVKQVCSAVRYLHSKGIIHRDLKLENFLFSTSEKDSELKMCDFGLSKHFKTGEKQSEVVGTYYSVAPEVILGRYDERCDIWAVGVITYLLLSGESPFGGCGDGTPRHVICQNITRASYKFTPPEIWDKVSSEARAFIRALLVVNPSRRPTAQEVQNLPWLKTWAERSRNENDIELNPNVVHALVNFKGLSDIRRLLSEVLSFTLLPDQIKGLRSEFEKIDTDGSGEISLEALERVLVSSAGTGSLGALAKDEIHEIFQAMSVSKGSRIHWHEFLAATLSQSQVDDRNLRLAFDRLDSDHKGYIAIDDIMDLLGTAAHDYEEMVTKSMGDVCLSEHRRITFDDFLLIMKGQANDTIEPLSAILSQSDALDLDQKREAQSMSALPDDFGTSSDTSEARHASHRRFRSLSEKGQKGFFKESDSDVGSKADFCRARIQLRLAIVEACKRFEDLQRNRASIALQLHHAAAGKATAGAAPASLVMRNVRPKQFSAEALIHATTQSEAERQEEQAFKRSGRGRRGKMKTVSDMYGMLSTTHETISQPLEQPKPPSRRMPMDRFERFENPVSTLPFELAEGSALQVAPNDTEALLLNGF